MFITSIQLTSRRCILDSSRCQSRFLHGNSKKFKDLVTRIPFPDLHLAKTFEKRYRSTEEGHTLGLALRYPKTMTRYWRVAQVMQRKGLIPFVHGQTIVWSIPQRILKALGYSGCQLLRFWNSDTQKTRAEIFHRINSIDKDNNAKRQAYPLLSRLLPFIFIDQHLDHTPELRDRLLAVTIGLFHLERKESPFSFVIGGIYGNPPRNVKIEGNRNILPLDECKRISNGMITEAMAHGGYGPEVSAEILRNMEPLYQKAEQLLIGQFLVCGVPYESLSTAVYHCEPLGIPTGLPMDKVLKDLSVEALPQTCQARLLLCKETMAQDSRIEIVNIMDESQVQSFCEGWQKDFLPDEEEESLKDVIVHKKTEMEEREITQIKQLYEQIDRIIQAYSLNKKEHLPSSENKNR